MGWKRPQLLIVGIQKAGTTFLSGLLKQSRWFAPSRCYHWDIGTGHFAVKEVHFWDNFRIPNASLFGDYLRGWEYLDRGEATDKVADVDQVIRFEASPSYSRYSFCPCRIRHLMPDVKIVTLLREPASRTVSEIAMMLGKRHEPQLVKRIQQRLRGEIRELQELQCTFQGDDARLRKSWRDCFRCEFGFTTGSEQCFPTQLPVDETTNTTGGRYHIAGTLTKGLYAPMIAWWLEYFPPSQLLLVSMQDLVADPIGVANRVSRFVGVPPEFDQSFLVDENGEVKDLTPTQHSGWRELSDEEQQALQEVNQTLSEFYGPVTNQLYELLGAYGYDLPIFK